MVILTFQQTLSIELSTEMLIYHTFSLILSLIFPVRVLQIKIIIIFCRFQNINFFLFFSASPSCNRLVVLVENDRCDEPHPPIQDHPQSDGRCSLRTSQGSLQHLEGRSLYKPASTRRLLLIHGLQTKQEKSGKTNSVNMFQACVVRNVNN